MDPQELASIPLFSDLSEDDLSAVATYADEVTVSEGKHLVDEGGYAYDLFAIIEGTAQVIMGGKVVAELGPGDFFGEAGVLEKQQRNAHHRLKSQVRDIDRRTIAGRHGVNPGDRGVPRILREQ